MYCLLDVTCSAVVFDDLHFVFLSLSITMGLKWVYNATLQTLLQLHMHTLLCCRSSPESEKRLEQTWSCFHTLNGSSKILMLSFSLRVVRETACNESNPLPSLAMPSPLSLSHRCSLLHCSVLGDTRDTIKERWFFRAWKWCCLNIPNISHQTSWSHSTGAKDGTCWKRVIPGPSWSRPHIATMPYTCITIWCFQVPRLC